jgi:organic hydroperoxide reductase OsmC/OhrA
MAEHVATVEWKRGSARFSDNRYSREHLWKFDGGAIVTASASPHVVPTPLSNAEAVDPEEAFVAALSSCHMLWFLSIAAQKGYVVDHYHDDAVGTMEKNDRGRMAITKVVLRPLVSFSGEHMPNDAQVEVLHHQAHESCFLANSVRCDVIVEPRSS